MPIDTQYVCWMRQVAFPDGFVPVPQNPVVLFNDDIGWAFRPLEQIFESLPRTIVEIEEVQVYVKN